MFKNNFEPFFASRLSVIVVVPAKSHSSQGRRMRRQTMEEK